jgi:ribokinase
MRVAVVGHVERVEFIEVEQVPAAGEIVHARRSWVEPAGGGAVAAVELARLAGRAELFCGLEEGVGGELIAAELGRLGVDLRAARQPGPQARAVVFIDGQGERTITVLGPQLLARGGDPLPWAGLAACDAVYYAKGDPAAVRACRAARVLVATARELRVIREAGVELDALVLSASDAGERYEPGALSVPPRLVVVTAGAEGGRFQERGGDWQIYPSAPLPGPRADGYGCGDSFAAGLTFALGRGLAPAAALAVAARSGAAALCRRGAQLASPACQLPARAASRAV